MLPDVNENKKFEPGKISTIDSVEIHNSDNTCEDKMYQKLTFLNRKTLVMSMIPIRLRVG